MARRVYGAWSPAPAPVSGCADEPVPHRVRHMPECPHAPGAGDSLACASTSIGSATDLGRRAGRVAGRRRGAPRSTGWRSTRGPCGRASCSRRCPMRATATTSWARRVPRVPPAVLVEPCGRRRLAASWCRTSGGPCVRLAAHVPAPAARVRWSVSPGRSARPPPRTCWRRCWPSDSSPRRRSGRSTTSSGVPLTLANAPDGHRGGGGGDGSAGPRSHRAAVLHGPCRRSEWSPRSQAVHTEHMGGEDQIAVAKRELVESPAAERAGGAQRSRSRGWRPWPRTPGRGADLRWQRGRRTPATCAPRAVTVD